MVVTVMVAVPTLAAVITPFSSTVATAVLSLFQVTLLSNASDGVMVAISVTDSPINNSAEVLSKDTDVT